MPDVRNDPVIFQEFRDALGARDPKTIATYLTTMRDFVTWLAAQPGGTPFHLGLLTETAVRGYLDSLKLAGRASRTRSKALSSEDLNIIAEHRRPHNRLGFTVQLAYLRYPGRAWSPEEPIPPNILTYLG